jgi:NADH dehydrogenase
MPSPQVVTVFGGTGFLGRRVVRNLREHDFSVRVASRHPDRARRLFGADDLHIRPVKVDIHDERSVAAALADAFAAVNSVSLYVEHGSETFHAVHVAAAHRVAEQARRAGVEHLVHVSGIGSHPASQSLYIRKRGEGELAVRAAFADAVVIRPAVMFAQQNGFLQQILTLLRRLPVYPMFGNGQTRLQPVHADDVAEAITRVLRRTASGITTFEFGGPRVYSYEELLRIVASAAGLKPILVPFPFIAWHALAWSAEMLPAPPLTRNQVELMQVDTVASAELPGLDDLGISPRSVEQALTSMPSKH